MALELASWVDDHEDWERLAPVPLSTICFRFRPASLSGRDDEATRKQLDAWNAEILDQINGSGRFYLSSTRLRECFTLRVALGNPRAGRKHVEGCWQLLVEIGSRIRKTG